MEQLKNPKKMILCMVIAIIIIIGIIMIASKGFNVELRYTANQTIQFTIGERVDVEKIQEKVDEVFGKGFAIVQVVELYKDTVQVTAKEITEEQKNSLVQKINELYPQEPAIEGEEAPYLLDASDITINSNENARLRDILKPYIIPLTIATSLVLAYYAIRYRKLGVVKVLIESGVIMAIAQALLLSVLAIVRFPMGRLTTPLILLVYVVSLIYTSGNLMKAEKAKRQEEVTKK